MRSFAVLVLLLSGFACSWSQAGLAVRVENASASSRHEVAAELFLLDSSPNGERGWWHRSNDASLHYYSDWEDYRSTDGGRTWSDPVRFEPPDASGRESMRCVIALHSGELAVLASSEDRRASGSEDHRLMYWRHDLETGTWSQAVRVNHGGEPGLPYSGGALIQMKSGRLVLPVRNFAQPHSEVLAGSIAVGWMDGRKIEITEHARIPEFESSYCWLSDDAGRSWFRSEGEIFIWRDRGLAGAWSMDEPVVVEVDAGGLLMMARTVLGQLYSSTSSDGLRWSEPKPSGLAASASPCQLARLDDGGIVCVWNQVSTDEIQRGFWRGRLSCAVSYDSGQSWEEPRTLDVQGLPALRRVAATEPALTHPNDDCGELPRDYGNVSYPTLGVIGSELFVRYRRRVWHPRRKNSDRVVIVPLAWLTESRD